MVRSANRFHHTTSRLEWKPAVQLYGQRSILIAAVNSDNSCCPLAKLTPKSARMASTSAEMLTSPYAATAGATSTTTRAAAASFARSTTDMLQA